MEWILVGIVLYAGWIWIDSHRYVNILIPSPLVTVDDDEHLSRLIMEALRKSKYWRSYLNYPYGEVSGSREDLPLVIGFQDDLKNGGSLSLGVSHLADWHGSGCGDKIRLHVVPHQNRRRAYVSDLTLYLTQNVRLTIHEMNKAGSRNGTRKALDYIARLKQAAMDNRIDEWVQKEGSVLFLNRDQAAALAANEVFRFYVANADSGCLEGYAEGWINCGEPGMVEFECLDPATGHVLNERKKHRTKELVGWSPDPSNYYLFGSNFCVDGDGEARMMRIDIRFTPSAGGSARTIYSTNMMVRTWVR